MCKQGRGYAPTLEQSDRIKTDDASDILSDLISNLIQSRDNGQFGIHSLFEREVYRGLRVFVDPKIGSTA